MGRHDVLMAPTDLDGLGLADGARSSSAPLTANWLRSPAADGSGRETSRPSGQRQTCCSRPGVRDPEALIPEYNAVVEVIPG